MYDDVKDTEEALVALGNPLCWVWQSDEPGGKGYWEGKSETHWYRLFPPAFPDDVDAPPSDRSWRICIIGADRHLTPVNSVEQAKQLCARHAITGDESEIASLYNAAKVAATDFAQKKDAANAQLFGPFRTHNTPWLKWQPPDLKAQQFHMTASRGTYHVTFDLERRWVVRWVQEGIACGAYCFVTRPTAKMACSFHAHTGQWLGAL